MAHLMTDFDDVVFPLIDSIHALALEEGLHDGTAPPREWNGWLQYGCTEETYWALWDTFRARKGYEDTPAIPGALEALTEAKAAGHTIHVVTARGFFPDSAAYVRVATAAWIRRFAPDVVDSLSFAQDKPAAQRHLGVTFDAAYDDSPKHQRALRDAGVDAYLINHAHNEGFPAPRGQRVPSLAEGLRAHGWTS